MTQILKAFKVLYENKVLHRDIKPANILLHNGVCKLADFGVSKLIDDQMGQANLTFTGTLVYMAPQLL